MQVHLAANNFAQHLGKLVCHSQDRPGFIVNRVLMPMINEAFYTLMEVSNTAFAYFFRFNSWSLSQGQQKIQIVENICSVMQCSHCQFRPAPLQQHCMIVNLRHLHLPPLPLALANLLAALLACMTIA